MRETYLCKSLKCKSLDQLTTRWLFADSEGLKNFVLCFLLEPFLRKYLNKDAPDQLICFAKICEFIFACIVTTTLPV